MTDAARRCERRFPGEIILGVLPGGTPGSRTTVVLRHDAAGTAVRLRSESFSGDVGWFVQGCVDLPGEQLAGLRNLLGAAGSMPVPRTPGAATVPFPAAPTPTVKGTAGGAFPPTVPFTLRAAG